MGWPSIRTVPGGGVVEAGDETDEGGFAGAGGAYDGEAGAGGDAEVDVVEDGWSVRVGEGEVAELDVAGNGSVGGGGIVGDGGLLLEEFVDADDGGGSALEEVDDPADGDHGPGELHHVDVEGGELADGDAVGDDLVAADEEGDHEREAEDELERGPEHGHEADEVEAALDVLEVGGLEGGDLGLFLGEGADEAGAGEVLLGLGGDVGEHGLDALEAAMDAVAEVLDEDRGHGSGTKAKKVSLGLMRYMKGSAAAVKTMVLAMYMIAGPRSMADGVEVVGGAGHDVAGAVGVVVAGRLAFEVGEDVVAEVELDFARGSDDDLAADVEEDGGERGDEEQAEGVVEDSLLGDAVLHVVDGVADDDGDAGP